MDVDSQESASSNTTGSPKECLNIDNLWDPHDSMTSEMTTTDYIGDLDSQSHQFEEHLNCYLREPLLLRNAIFEYWASNPYVHLRPVATKYLSAPPTSVPSEQLFSAAGQIYDDRRANLLGENVDRLLFLMYNIRIFNFDY
nr:unnamed protein product [Callosobruchus analis]